ncbi:MAG: helix-turn-helix transcriptional regulator [Bacteroidales bacterium]|nr:helix-turn-helix transcriptional regulator [Bacteroidales bacterium]
MIDLKSFLKREKMTKAALCRKIGIDPKSSLLSAYEKGRSCPSYDVCVKLLEAGMMVEELFGVEYKKMHQEFIVPPSTQEIFDSPEFQLGMKRTIEKLKKEGLL